MLLIALIIAGALWYWLRRRGVRITENWIPVAGALIGALLMAKGQPVVGALVTTGSGLWLRFGGTLFGQRSNSNPSEGRTNLDRAEAADLLGISPDASPEAINAAWRKLMARNHPDSGGSAGLAARINAARDLLLKSQES